MSEPRPICDFLLTHEGVECICEIYSGCDGHVEEFTVYLLLEDGSKGDWIDEEDIPNIQELVHERYTEYGNRRFDDDVI